MVLAKAEPVTRTALRSLTDFLAEGRQGHDFSDAWLKFITLVSSMKARTVSWISLLSASLTGVGHAAGGPLTQDLSPLSVAAQKTVDAASAQQRIVGKLKAAVAAGKAGTLSQGTQAVDEAMTDMKKAEPPRFGGGS